MKTLISRPINGISLNGDEYLLNREGAPMEFASEDVARNFLMENGISKQDLDGFNFKSQRGEVETVDNSNKRAELVESALLNLHNFEESEDQIADIQQAISLLRKALEG